MASQKSFLKFRGNIEGLNFYRKADGTYHVRSMGGVEKDRIKNDPAFERTRENNREFGQVASAAKRFKRAVQNLIYDVNDPKRTTRLNSILHKVKALDTTSPRGERKVSIGMQADEAKEVLKYFDFNEDAPLDVVLKANYGLDTTNEEVSIPQFSPKRNLDLAEGATHVRIEAARLRFDFASGEYELIRSNEEEMIIEDVISDLVFSFSGSPTGNGLDYYFLKVAFFQSLNGEMYPLNNGAFNALQLIEVE